MRYSYARMYRRMNESKITVCSGNDYSHMSYSMTIPTSKENQIAFSQIAEPSTYTTNLLALTGRGAGQMNSGMTEHKRRKARAVESFWAGSAICVWPADIPLCV